MFDWDKLNKQKLTTSVNEDYERIHRELRETVLLLDDEPVILDQMSVLLEDKYDIICCNDPVEALEYLDQDNISCIISDQRMPKMTGTEFFIEAEKRNHKATRIVLTGYSDLDNVVKAFNKGGVFRYLSKPVEHDELFKTVELAVESYITKQNNLHLIKHIKNLLSKFTQIKKHFSTSIDLEDHADIKLNEFIKPQKSLLSILNLDLRNFTAFANSVSPNVVIETLQTIYAPIYKIIQEHGGIIDKHMGDGLMAIFGMGIDNAKSSSLKCIEEISKEFEKIIKNVESIENYPKDIKLKMGAGLSHGEVILGHIGSSVFNEFAVIGKTANMSSRLQELTKMAFNNDKTVLGHFENFMAVIDANIVQSSDKYDFLKEVNLNDELKVRNFPDIKKIFLIKS